MLTSTFAMGAWLAGIAVLAFLAYRLLRGVPPRLHTPLMSSLNALSGVALVAALAAYPSSQGWERVAVGCAMLLATINIVGGYLVTNRMMQMLNR